MQDKKLKQAHAVIIGMFP